MRDAMVFVDAQNFQKGAEKYDSDFKYDAVKLRETLTEDYYTVRSYWFDSYAPDGGKQDFFYFLDMNGYQVVSTPLRERDDGYVEKGVDIRLATELLAQGFNDSYDTAFLVSGDGDYIRAVDYVQSLGKRVVVASWEENVSGDMKKKSDQFVELNEIASAIEM